MFVAVGTREQRESGMVHSGPNKQATIAQVLVLKPSSFFLTFIYFSRLKEFGY